MTDKAPERIHVRWGKSGDTRVTYMEERFWPPDNEAEYVRADLLDAANARIAALEAMLTEDVTAPYLAGLARGRAEALEEAAKACEDTASEAVFFNDNHGMQVSLRSAAAIRALKGGSNG